MNGYHPKDGVGDPTQFHYIRAVFTLHPLQLSDVASQPAVPRYKAAKFHEPRTAKELKVAFQSS
jgi:hypothetical protein